ncbi:ABC transporter substrate-binding protein [Streptomyces armeniacus]|uniref:ABC transporter substrate-binding protein n=1 Tax=Streptomyces armeniacus TaxID=83291 RepID=UPI00267931F2
MTSTPGIRRTPRTARRPRTPRSRTRPPRALAALAVLSALALLLSGCSGDASGSSGGKVTLTFAWWGNDDRHKRTNEAVDLFEKRHPNVTVRTSFASYESYVQKLATQAAGGDLPDVAQLDYRQISQYAGSDTLRDLGPYVKSGALRTGAFDKELLSTGAYEGTQYALPMGSGTTGFAYDAAVFEKAGVDPPKPGWTWQEWADAGRAVSDLGLKGPNGKPYTGHTDMGVHEDAFEMWLRSRGKQLYASEDELGFTARDLARFWSFTDKLRREGVVSQAKDTSQISGAVESGPMGRKLAATDFTWDAPFLGYPPLLGDSVHFAPVPTTGGKAGQYIKPTMLLGVGANSEHPKEAAELVDFLLNDPAAGDILGVTRGVPPNQEIAERVSKDLKGPEKELYDFGKKVIRYGVDPPPKAPPRGDVVLQVSFSRVYQQVVYERQSPAEAAEEYVAEAERELR